MTPAFYKSLPPITPYAFINQRIWKVIAALLCNNHNGVIHSIALYVSVTSK